MIFLYAVIILSLLFALSFIYQIIDTWKFFYIKTLPKKEDYEEHIPKKYVVKKKATLILSRKKNWLQSSVFYAKFLMEKPYKNLSISIKFLIEEIYTKLCFNSTYLKTKIAFDKLKHAGIFNGKPIYKIVVKDREKLEKELQALSVVYKFFDFRVIFLLDDNLDEKLIQDFIFKNASNIDYKVVLLKYININLLYEINKLNLNYEVKRRADKIEDFYFLNIDFNAAILKWNMEEYTSKNHQITLTKFIKTDEKFLESTIGYFVKFNPGKTKKRVQFVINYMLKSELFNVDKNNEFLEIKYYESFLKSSKFFFSKDLKKFEIQKSNGKVFLSMHFSVLLNDKQNFFVLLEGFDEIKRLNFKDINQFILNNNLKIDRLFKFKVYVNDSEFNEFFNKKLKNLIINEKLRGEKDNFSIPDSITKIIERNFNFSRKKMLEFSSYFDFYNFFIEEGLGIQEKPSGIFLSPKKEYYKRNFKLILLGENGSRHSIYVEQNSDFKGLEIGDVFYTNLKLVDLSLINKNAKLCI